MLCPEKGYSYFNFFKKLCDGEYSRIELNKFIEKLFIIAESYVGYNYKRIKQLVNSSRENIKEIAAEAISPLFHYSKKSRQFIIVDKIKKWNPPINSEKDALFFLNKIIANRVEQHLCSVLRKADPFFSKILESINYLIRKGDYKKVNHLGRVFITEKSNSVINKKVIPVDELQNFPQKLFYDRKVIFNSLFNFIRTETNYFPAIPLNELICILKHINASDYLHIESDNDIFHKFEMSEILNSGLLYTKKKLRSSYLDKGKLNEVEYTGFKKALESLAADLGNGGLNPKLHSYITPHFNGLTNEEYYNKYHNILEYLLKQLKAKIANAICALTLIFSDFNSFLLEFLY